jgi:hypothetical protein
MAESKIIHIIRPISVYVNGDKQADIKSGTYKLDGNREAQYTDGGYTGHSSGAKFVTMNIKQIVGVTTSSFAIIHNYVLNDLYVVVAIPVEGQMINFTGVIKGAGLDWDHKAGTAEGNADFEGGQVLQI